MPFRTRAVPISTTFATRPLLAYGYFIVETPGAKDYDEAVKLRGMTYEQAAAEIKAKVAEAMRWEERDD